MERTHRIMFVCHGNICRSPMAEFLLKDMIKKDSVSEYMNSGYNFYARLLGFRKDCSQILTEISKKSSLPLLTKLAESRELCELGQRMLRDDILASNLYTSVVTDKFKTAFLNEYKQRIIKI